MWSLLRLLLVTLALTGFVGQTTARAMPMTMAAETMPGVMRVMDCADMPGMAMAAHQDVTDKSAPAKPVPCKGMTPDCIGKMGCASLALTPPISVLVPTSKLYAGVRFVLVDQDQDGLVPAPPFTPPIGLA
jgi:hypothetical protein